MKRMIVLWMQAIPSSDIGNNNCNLSTSYLLGMFYLCKRRKNNNL